MTKFGSLIIPAGYEDFFEPVCQLTLLTDPPRLEHGQNIPIPGYRHGDELGPEIGTASGYLKRNQKGEKDRPCKSVRQDKSFSFLQPLRE